MIYKSHYLALSSIGVKHAWKLCHLYSHLSAPVQVGCVSEPQTWSVLLQNGTHPTQAWTPEVTLLHCVHVYYDTECLCGAFNFSVCGSFPILTLVNSYLIYHKFPWFVLLITVTSLCANIYCRTISTVSKKVQVLWGRVHPTRYWTVRECLPLPGVVTMVFTFLWQLLWPSNTGIHAILLFAQLYGSL